MDTTSLKQEIRKVNETGYAEAFSRYENLIQNEHGQVLLKKKFENDYKMRTTKAAEKFIELGLTENHSIKVVSIGYDFNIIAEDEKGSYCCRAVFCAAQSIKVSPHWRNIVTFCKK